MYFMCLPMNEPLLEWYKANKFICCVYVPSRLFLHPRLWWQLSSMMTEAVLTPLHWVLFLWWPWWWQWLRLSRRWCPLTHLDAPAKQSSCIHVARFVMLPLLINISCLFTRSKQQLHIWLSWEEDFCLWGVRFLFTFFSLRFLWVWPWSNYRSKVGRCCFHSKFHNVGFVINCD